MSFQSDKTTGQNGDKLHLTITALGAGTENGGSEFQIVSTNQKGTRKNFSYGFVTN